MNAKTTLLIAAALAFAAMPMANADPYGTNCSDPSTYDSTDVQCLTIAGPGSVTHKSLLGAGLGVCTTDAGSPVPCNDPSAPAAGVGAAIFDGSTISTGNHLVSAWVEYLGNGVCGVGTTCGFDLLLCNDRDYDGICTNLPDPATAPDQLFYATSNEPVVGEDCSNTDKDLKNCPDPTEAEASGCMIPALAPLSNWNYGQIVVFVGNWVDTWPGTPETELTNATPTNIGAGVAVGSFDVWLNVGGAC